MRLRAARGIFLSSMNAQAQRRIRVSLRINKDWKDEIVPRPTPDVSQISRMLAPAVAISSALRRSNMTRFRPSCSPWCLALLIPLRTRFWISSRSKSATDARMWSNNPTVGLLSCCRWICYWRIAHR